MFHEWFAAGAVFGIKAFFAVIAFLGFSVVTLGILTLVARILTPRDEGSDADDLHRD